MATGREKPELSKPVTSRRCVDARTPPPGLPSAEVGTIVSTQTNAPAGGPAAALAPASAWGRQEVSISSPVVPPRAPRSTPSSLRERLALRSCSIVCPLPRRAPANSDRSKKGLEAVGPEVLAQCPVTIPVGDGGTSALVLLVKLRFVGSLVERRESHDLFAVVVVRVEIRGDFREHQRARVAHVEHAALDGEHFAARAALERRIRDARFLPHGIDLVEIDRLAAEPREPESPLEVRDAEVCESCPSPVALEPGRATKPAAITIAD